MNKTNDQILDQRKADHISLTDQAQTLVDMRNHAFDYEPLFATHPKENEWQRPTNFLGKKLKAPLWISSMTGGTKEALQINRNLAQAANEFGLGFGLGSCRSLLTENTRFHEFDLRSMIGDELPFFANLGVAQVEELIAKKELNRLHDMVEKLRADGLIIHINPLQEWFQPEGDRFMRAPIETIQEFLKTAPYQVIVKEVGQGMGPRSLKALMQLPLAAIDFAAFGGTNFSKLEHLRGVTNENHREDGLEYVGHSAAEMLTEVHQIMDQIGSAALCRSFIISGGIRGALQAHELLEKVRTEAVYAQAKPFLDHARSDYAHLQKFVRQELLELEMARRFLVVRGNEE